MSIYASIDRAVSELDSSISKCEERAAELRAQVKDTNCIDLKNDYLERARTLDSIATELRGTNRQLLRQQERV